MDEFLRLEASLGLSVIKPHGVEIELNRANTPEQVRGDMSGIYTLETALIPDEVSRREAIRTLMTGNAQSDKHKDDADHLFETSKYGGGYFVTHDRRIHKRKAELASLAPGVQVVTLEEMVEVCRQYAKQRHQ
ncbi:hypothetical protein GR167_17235 [Rhodobacteraceae bacterium GS-10]|uniref:PIN domain-containing protein n=1 Tax=Thalassovita mangrovi TaxID=2692236 RepID=A0A6L8LM34_9RHOB|nr:hypothetical protein [Thalassovita mangrovi]